ncbi:MAG: hypothetical protein HOW73_09195 [Polyangiaceae bacterium]|nr:hypothetical protein [Polyangiaceae bacterium]
MFAAWAFGATGCVLHDGPPQVVEQGPIVTDPKKLATPRCNPSASGEPASSLCAGAAEVDITPPPGMPTYGYSTNGVAEAKGYWLRLKARILVFEKPDETGESVTRLVLIQADLGAASGLVHRKLANELRQQGIGPANLLVATTHTHGGPGGFFGDKFYNKSVGAKPAFIPEYVDALVSTMKDGIALAFADLKPARLGVAEADVDVAASHNRSYDAWKENYASEGVHLPDNRADAVDHTLRLLRVDTIRDGKYKPRALWSVFGVHGTAMPPDYPLYHGDVHGLAARLAKHWIEEGSGVDGFVAAMATGAEGDVGPGNGKDDRGKGLVMKVAAEEAKAAVRAYRSLGTELPAGGPDLLDFAYEEVSLRGAGTSLGHLCEVGVLGASEAGGSEDSRGPLYGAFGMVEGEPHDPRGCQATKDKIGGAIQDLAFQPTEYPDLVPFQVVAFGDRADARGLFLASFPGEPTTEVGRLVRKKIAQDYPGTIAVVGLTNSYATYFTTPSEYLAQHYEGGATLYGPYQGIFAAEQLQRVSQWIGVEDEETRQKARFFPAKRTFQPGESKGIYPTKPSCDVGAWRPIGVTKSQIDVAGSAQKAKLVTFQWSGMEKSETCALPSIAVECRDPDDSTKWKTWVDERGYRADDEGFDFEVWRDGDSTWSATWAERGDSSTPCRFAVRPRGANAIVSATFEVKR